MPGHHKHQLYYEPYKSIGELRRYKFLNISTTKLEDLFKRLNLTEDNISAEIYKLVTEKKHEDNRFELCSSYKETKELKNNFTRLKEVDYFQQSLGLKLYQHKNNLTEFRLLFYLNGRNEKSSCLRLKEKNAGSKITTAYGNISDFIKRLEDKKTRR